MLACLFPSSQSTSHRSSPGCFSSICLALKKLISRPSAWAAPSSSTAAGDAGAGATASSSVAASSSSSSTSAAAGVAAASSTSAAAGVAAADGAPLPPLANTDHGAVVAAVAAAVAGDAASSSSSSPSPVSSSTSAAGDPADGAPLPPLANTDHGAVVAAVAAAVADRDAAASSTSAAASSTSAAASPAAGAGDPAAGAAGAAPASAASSPLPLAAASSSPASSPLPLAADSPASTSAVADPASDAQSVVLAALLPLDVEPVSSSPSLSHSSTSDAARAAAGDAGDAAAASSASAPEYCPYVSRHFINDPSSLFDFDPAIRQKRDGVSTHTQAHRVPNSIDVLPQVPTQRLTLQQQHDLDHPFNLIDGLCEWLNSVATSRLKTAQPSSVTLPEAQSSPTVTWQESTTPYPVLISSPAPSVQCVAVPHVPDFMSPGNNPTDSSCFTSSHASLRRMMRLTNGNDGFGNDVFSQPSYTGNNASLDRRRGQGQYEDVPGFHSYMSRFDKPGVPSELPDGDMLPFSTSTFDSPRLTEDTRYSRSASLRHMLRSTSRTSSTKGK